MKRLLFLILALSASPAHAAPTGNNFGNNLYKNCSSDTTSFEGAVSVVACNNYIVGVVDGLVLSGEANRWFAMPDGVTGQQLQDIVLKYLRDNPNKRHLPGPVVIINAMSEAFPPKAQ